MTFNVGDIVAFDNVYAVSEGWNGTLKTAVYWLSQSTCLRV